MDAIDEVVDYTLLAVGSGKSYGNIIRDSDRLLAELGLYIWHRESFSLNNFAFGGIPCLFGSTDFGGCIEDEWTVVWVLKRLSELHPDIYVRVADSDGEFLMIEAARVLPKWITPDNAENRVWINKGRISIIPQHVYPGRPLSIEEALNYLRQEQKELAMHQDIDKEAFARIQNYPAAAIEYNTHRASVVVPRKVAGLLHRFPQYISSAVESFTSRDGQSDGILRKMRVFPPKTGVQCTVRFTRRQYAILKSDGYRPPWRYRGDASEAKKLGEKVACGMELLAEESLRKRPLEAANVETHPDFVDIIDDLTERGYFMGYSPNSVQYTELKRQAIKPFIDARRISNEIAFLPSRIQQEPPSLDEIASWDKTVDDEKWLHVELEMAEQEEHPPEDFQELLSRLEKFMGDEGTAGLDAELDDDSTSSDSDSEASSSSDDNDGDEEVIGPDDPRIDEDDFLEFFMKEALKLSPEEIESYRADETKEPDAAETQEIEQELREKGVLPDQSDPSYDTIVNLLKSLKAGGASGPAATLLGQLDK